MPTTDLNPVEHIFKEVCPSGDSLEDIIDILGRFGLHNFGYNEEFGLNPGYMFRGEIAYGPPDAFPLQSRLEREAIKQNRCGIGQLKDLEKEIVEGFVKSSGAQVARLREPDNSKSLEDVFWWLSWMQHYEKTTRFIDFTRDIRFALYFAVEQFFDHQKRTNKSSPKDLIIYCFPCKNLFHSKDEDNNKTPFRFSGESIDMNKALGCEIDLEWMKCHKADYQARYDSRRHKQFFGWDRPYYKNPRLNRQRGMFVYAFDYPEHILISGQESWFIRSLSKANKSANPYTPENSSLSAIRVRIAHKHVEGLDTLLKDRFGLCYATVYI